MKVIFLGTGTSQGIPVIGCKCDVCSSLDYRDKRLRASIYVEYEGVKMVVDTGPDFRQQMLRERIDQLENQVTNLQATLKAVASDLPIKEVRSGQAQNLKDREILEFLGE